MLPWSNDRFVVLTLFTLACGAQDDGGSDGADTSSESGAACEPGELLACTCTDGSSGEQVCKAAGDGYWPCECDLGTSTAGTEGGSQSGSQSGTSASSTSADGSASASSTGEATGGPMCEGSHPIVDGDTRSCEPDACYCKPTDACFPAETAAGCCDDAVLCGGASCQGSHPIVDGDMRYCDPGFCYCGDLAADPPLDTCYAADQADACCPVELECA